MPESKSSGNSWPPVGVMVHPLTRYGPSGACGVASYVVSSGRPEFPVEVCPTSVDVCHHSAADSPASDSPGWYTRAYAPPPSAMTGVLPNVMLLEEIWCWPTPTQSIISAQWSRMLAKYVRRSEERR